MLKLNEFSHTHHLSRVKMLAKYIRRGIRALLINFLFSLRQRNIAMLNVLQEVKRANTNY